MQLTIEKNQLIFALSAVAKGMSSRSTMPILSGVLLIAEDKDLILRTTDLEISIQHTTAALVEEAGETVVPGRLFSEIIKSLPEAAVSLTDHGSGLTVSCGNSTFTINTLNPLDYPSFPSVDAAKQIKIAAAALQGMVRKVLKAVSKDESRPVLMGVLLKIQKDKLLLVSTDSYRLAITEKTLTEDKDFELIVPGGVLEEITRTSKADDEIAISESENQIMFETGQTVLISRKIEGSYPNYDVLVPKEKVLTAVLNTQELLTVIRRVAIASQNHSPIKLVFDPAKQTITVSSKTLDVASASETIDAQIEGEYLEIGFNHQYISDGLSVAETEEIRFESQGSLKPGVLKTSGDEEFLYLTMPVRIDI